MIGGFKDGRGEFYSQEVFEGGMFTAASSGPRSQRTPVNGSRLFQRMAAKPGKQTGSWSLSEYEQANLFSHSSNSGSTRFTQAGAMT